MSSRNRLPKVFAGGIAAMALLLVVGCAAHSAHVHGRNALERGNRRAALEHYRRAVQLDPRDDDYRREVKRIEQELTTQYTAEATRLFEDRDMAAAQARVDEGLGILPLAQELRALQPKIEQAVADARRHRGQAVDAARKQEWNVAHYHMQCALALDRSLPDGTADMERIEERATIHSLDTARRAMDYGHYDNAEEWVNLAAKFGKDPAGVKSLLDEIATRREAAARRAQADDARARGDLEQALALYIQVEQLHPNQDGLSTALHQTRAGLCEQYLATAERARANGDLHGALAACRRSHELLPDYGRVRQRMAALRDQLAAGHTAMATNALENGRPGRAIAHFACARDYSPHSRAPGLFVAAQQLAEHTRFHIGFLISESWACDPRAAGELLKRTWGDIERAFTGTRRAYTLEQTQALLAQANVGRFTLARSTDLGNALSGVNQLDALVLVECGEIELNRSEQVATEQTTYLGGTRQVANPAYAQALRQVEAANRDLQAAQQSMNDANKVSMGAGLLSLASGFVPGGSDLATGLDIAGSVGSAGARINATMAGQKLAQAQSAYQAAQTQLANTPQYRQVASEVTADYPVRHVSLTARIPVAFRVIDCASGREFDRIEVAGEFTARDRTVNGDSQRNIAHDPLELPGEYEARDQALNHAADMLAEKVRALSDSSGCRFLELARQSARSTRNAEAIEYAVAYLMTEPKQVDESVWELFSDGLPRDARMIDVPAAMRAMLEVVRSGVDRPTTTRDFESTAQSPPGRPFSEVYSGSPPQHPARTSGPPAIDVDHLLR